MKVELVRRPCPPGRPTIGDLYIDGRRLCVTLELPWRDNAAGVSCIPAGTYRMIWAPSPRLKKHTWRLRDVPGRDGILIHTANHDHQLRGCIAPGVEAKDIDGDGRTDVTQSRVALALLESTLLPHRSTGLDIIIR